MSIMSFRGAFAATKQSPCKRGDCFAIARNDMLAKVNVFPRASLGDDVREWRVSTARMLVEGLIETTVRGRGGVA